MYLNLYYFLVWPMFKIRAVGCCYQQQPLKQVFAKIAVVELVAELVQHTTS